MVSLLLLAAAFQAQPAFDFDVRSGLRVKVAKIPVVSGSWLQYYEDGWKKGYYSTSNDDLKVKSVDADTVNVDFSGYNGLATGQITYHREGSHLKVHYDLHWSGDKPAKIELTAGMISAEVMQTGTLVVDGKPTRSMAATTYKEPGMEPRKFAPNGTDFLFDSALTKVSIKTSSLMTLFDARGFDQDYAEGRSLFWFGDLGIDVAKDKPATYDVDWSFQPNPIPAPQSTSLTLSAVPVKGVITPDEHPPQIIPQPRTNQLKFDKPLELTGQYDYPAGRVRFWDADFITGLKRRFEMPAVDTKGQTIHVDGGVSKLGFHPGGYQITITENSISVLGEEDEGYHNGLRRLALLAFPHHGKVALPTGYLGSNPQIAWRGVHLFVGPEARTFQKKLWERVLLPLGFNKVVLQCERTEWDSLPNTHGEPNYMTKQELAGLFADYRAIGVEPIPLIQSFGHMEWFFDKGQNLDVAVNPDVPYTLDPRKTKSSEMIGALWDEACDLLKPSAIHFGCDEVDMRGFPNDDTRLVTELWIKQMHVLRDIAKKHEAQMMLWGDMALAPEEAIDATNGVNGIEAIQRRAAIPQHAWIADWHYKPESKVESFLPSLQLWKKEGFKPFASAWYRPENVRSIDLAADVEKCGTLQTTWSGYFSDEKSMVDNFDQFTAMVLAGDYSWSTRYDSVGKVGYDPAQVFRNLYFGGPRSVAPIDGYQFFQGSFDKTLADGDMNLKLGEPIQLRSLLSATQAPTSATLTVSAKGKHFAICVDALDRCDDGEALGSITLRSANGTNLMKQEISYGRNIRTHNDKGVTPLADRVDGYSVIELQLPSLADIRTIQVDSTNPRGGLCVHGFIVW